MIIKFYETTLQKLRSQNQEYKDRISSGLAQNFDEYRFVCGKIQGFEEIEFILIELFDNLVNKNKKKDKEERFDTDRK